MDTDLDKDSIQLSIQNVKARRGSLPPVIITNDISSEQVNYIIEINGDGSYLIQVSASDMNGYSSYINTKFQIRLDKILTVINIKGVSDGECSTNEKNISVNITDRYMQESSIVLNEQLYDKKTNSEDDVSDHNYNLNIGRKYVDHTHA